MVESISCLLKSKWKEMIMIVLLFSAIMFSTVTFIDMKPIIIGFSAQLTGKQGELGVQERNGAELAVEKINESGGVLGHQLKLIVNDDYGIPDIAADVDSELIKSGAVAIIGHATTSQTLAGLRVTNPAKIVMLSPTVSTPMLSGIDDYFFRVYPSFKNSALAFGQYVYKKRGIRKISIIYDSDNLTYSQIYKSTFSEKFNELGGAVVSEVSFSSVSQPDFQALLAKINMNDSQGLLIIASDVDTALIAQRTKSINSKIELFTSAWAQTKTLIDNGGRAVEGMILEQSYSLNSDLPNFIDFKTRYEKRYGEDPSFGAAFAYEAVLVLTEALKKTGGRSVGLKEALTTIKEYKGVADTFSIDRFGDVERPFYLSNIKEGKYEIICKMTLQD